MNPGLNKLSKPMGSILLECLIGLVLIVPMLCLGFSWDLEAFLRLRQSAKIQKYLSKKIHALNRQNSECFEIEALNYFLKRRISVISKVNQMPKWDLLVPEGKKASSEACDKIQ